METNGLMKAKKWFILTIAFIVFFICFFAALTIVIDPFFHYHRGLRCLEYPLKDERYVNDGIQRNYTYEIMLTGTSMTWNFNASKIESLWGKKAIKTAYSGATFYELGQGMRNAIRHNSDLNTIICSFDPNKLSTGANEETYEGTPKYLFDVNPFNDVSYLLNKDVLLQCIAVINYTRAGNHTTTMDEYGRFDNYLPRGKEAVLSSYERMDEQDLSISFTDEDRKIIYDNVKNNFINVAKDHPEVSFIFYVPPYSYCHWDAMVRTNQMDYCIEAMEYAASLMLEQDNIFLYDFSDWTDITTNLDYYTDTLHYTGEVCDKISEAIYNNENLLNQNNYKEYYEEVKTTYENMDYDF